MLLATGDVRARHRYFHIALLALIAARLVISVASGTGYYWDFVNFYNTGSRMYHGEGVDLYHVAAPIAGRPPMGSSRFEYVGFPLSAYVFAPLGALAPRPALLAFKAACAACFALGLVVLFRHFRLFLGDGWQPDQDLSWCLLLILLFEPLWSVFVIGGQATPLVFLLLAVFLRSYTSDRLWLAAACLSAAALIKPFVGVMVVVFVMAGDWQLLLRLAGCVAVEAAASLLLFGWQPHLEWFHIVLKESSRWAVPWWGNCSLLAFFGNFWLYGGRPEFGLPPVPPMFAGLQVVAKIGLMATFLWLVRSARAAHFSPEEKRNYYVFLAVLFPLFLSTVVWTHYLAFLLIPLLFLLVRYRSLPKYVRVLTVLILISTVRANFWPIMPYMLDAIPVHTVLAKAAVGVYGSGTLILTLILLLAFHRDMLHTQRCFRAPCAA